MMASIQQFLWGEAPKDRFKFQNYSPKFTETTEAKDQNIEQIKESTTTVSAENRIVYDSDRKLYLIDGVIRLKIKDPSEIWKKYRDSCMNRAYCFVITAVLTGIGTKLITSSPMAKTATGVNAIGPFVVLSIVGLAFLGCLILTGINGYRAFRANQEVQMFDGDKHPELKIADERKQAYQQGFLYAYEQNLKLGAAPDSCLLPNEVEFLFKEYLLNYATAMINRNPRTQVEQQTWLTDWKKNNPLSHSLFSYGASPKLTVQFETLRETYTKWNNSGMMKQNIQGEIQRNWKIIEENRKKAFISLNKIEMALGIEVGKKIARASPGEEKDKMFKTLPIGFPLNTSITKFIGEEFVRQKREVEQNFAKFHEKPLKNTIQLYKKFLIQAINMIESPHLFNDLQQMFFTAPSIENRDFLNEAKEKFANNPEILAYLNTPTEDVELTG
ncbi:MAG: hypothetical protein ACXU9U_04590 [Parachlamydiaceae bacterium]